VLRHEVKWRRIYLLPHSSPTSQICRCPYQHLDGRNYTVTSRQQVDYHATVPGLKRCVQTPSYVERQFNTKLITCLLCPFPREHNGLLDCLIVVLSARGLSISLYILQKCSNIYNKLNTQNLFRLLSKVETRVPNLQINLNHYTTIICFTNDKPPFLTARNS